MPESSLPDGSQERALSLDIQRLWEMGAYDMPNLSGLYANASAELHKSTLAEGRLFVTPNSGGDGTVNEALSEVWMSVRDTLQTLMANSADNYRDIGEAVVKAAEDYASTDEAFKVELDAERSRLQGDEDYGTPPEPGAPVSPDDPPPSSGNSDDLQIF